MDQLRSREQPSRDGILSLNIPASRILRNKFLFFENYLISRILLQQHKQAKIVSIQMYLRHTLPHFFTHVSALYINVLPKEIQVLLLCIHAPCIHVTYTLLSHIHVSIITLTCTFLSGSKCSLNLVRCEVCNEAVGTLRRASLISTNLHCD